MSQQQDQRGSHDPITALLEDIRRQIETLIPADSLSRVLEGARDALNRHLGDLKLVPRSEFDGHLAALRHLGETIHALEERISKLEDAC